MRDSQIEKKIWSFLGGFDMVLASFTSNFNGMVDESVKSTGQNFSYESIRNTFENANVELKIFFNRLKK